MGNNAASPGRLTGYPVPFWMALAANTFFFFSFQSTFPVLPRFIAEVVLNLPPNQVGGQVGLATAATALVAVFIRVPAGRLADHWGRRRVMLAGALCYVAAPLLYLASGDMLTLMVGRVFHGLGLGSFTTAFQALATELAPANRRGAALGLAGASTSVAFVVAPLAGDWLAVNWGFASLFYVTAITATASVLMVLLINPPPPPSPGPALPSARISSSGTLDPTDPPTQPAQTSINGLRAALNQTGIRAGILTMAALGIPFGAFITFLPLFADERQIVGVGLVYSVYATTILLAQPLAGWLADRIGRPGVILPGLLVTTLATFVFALDASLWAFSLGGIIFGLGGGLVRGGIDPLVQDSVPSNMRGTAAAVQYTSFDFWIGAGSYPIGVLANTVGYATTFVATGLACAAGGVGLAFLIRRAPRT